MDNFHKLVTEDDHIMQNVDNYHQEILLLSRVLGANASAVLDENGSQSSSTSQYTNSITKKSRVQEIKSKIMLNVKKFYTLRLIKGLFISFMVLTLVFTIIYIFLYDSFITSTITIDNLHSSSLNILFFYIEIISLISSLKGLYIITNTNATSELYFNAYTSINIDDIEHDTAKAYKVYQETLYQLIMEIYGNLVSSTSLLELNYTREISNRKDNRFIWSMVSEGFSFDEQDNDIGLMMSIAQTLSYINNLINASDLYFPFEINKDEDVEGKIKYKTEYILKNIIENTYSSELSKLIALTTQMDTICSKENRSNRETILFFSVGYTAITVIFACLYAMFLYLTNKNMEDGMYVISKIEPMYIEETLKSIDTFNKTILSKFRKKGDRDQPIQRSKNFNETNMSTISAKSKEEEKEPEEENETGGFSDDNYHKKLSILSLSYLQSLCLIIIFGCFIIPVFLETNSLVNNANNFLETKEYFFNDLLKNALDVLTIKLKITSSSIREYVIYEKNTADEIKEIIINQINNYPKLNYFYKNKYILTICSVIWNNSTKEYNACITDTALSEYCSANDLFSLIQDKIYAINKNYEINRKEDAQKEFKGESFRALEYIHNKFFLNIPNKLFEVFVNSFEEYTDKKRYNMMLILIFMTVFLWMFSLYVLLYYMNSLINLLLISRCIFKIIPTKVINKTKELEDWIDDRY